MPRPPEVGPAMLGVRQSQTPAGLAADQSTPSQATMREERCSQLHDALARLSESDRQVIELRDFLGAPNRDVAQRLELSEAAASARYVRALERLGDLLSEFEHP